MSNTARVEFRMRADLKAEVVEAAELLGMDLTSFASETLLLRAREVRQGHYQAKLSEADGKRFLEMLENPPEPTPGLIELAKLEVPPFRS